MAVIVKLGQNDPNKRPQPKPAGTASKSGSAGSDSRLPSGGSEQWFRNRGLLGAIAGAILLMAVVWGVLNMQSPKPVAFPVSRATADEYDPAKTPQPTQAPAYDPN